MERHAESAPAPTTRVPISQNQRSVRLVVIRLAAALLHFAQCRKAREYVRLRERPCLPTVALLKPAHDPSFDRDHVVDKAMEEKQVDGPGRAAARDWLDEGSRESDIADDIHAAFARQP